MKSFRQFLESYNLPGSGSQADTLAGPGIIAFEGGDYESDYAYEPPTTMSPPNNRVRQFDKYSDFSVDKEFEPPKEYLPFSEAEFPWDTNDPLWQDPQFRDLMTQLYNLRQHWGNMEWFRANYGEPNQNNNFFIQMMDKLSSLRWAAWMRYDSAGRPIRLKLPNMNDSRWNQIFK